MYIKQISVFVENSRGRLSEFTKVLADNKIDMKALCIADTADFGILRCIVNEPEFATEVLQDNGFTASITPVLAVEMKDIPGGLHAITEILSTHGISIEYVYSIIRSREDHAVIILKVEDVEKAVAIFKEEDVKMYCQKDLM